MTRVSTSSAAKSVGTKVPPRKRPQEEAALLPQASLNEERSHQFTAEVISDTTVVIRKSVKPSDPPPSAPLVIKSISGGGGGGGGGGGEENVLDARSRCPRLSKITTRTLTKCIAVAVFKHTTSGTSPLRGISQQLPCYIITSTQFAPRCGRLKVRYKSLLKTLNHSAPSCNYKGTLLI